MKKSSLQSSKNSLQRIEVPSFSFLLEQQEFYFSCLIGMRMAQLVFVYFVLYLQNFIAVAMHMAAFSICHRSYHNIKRSFLPLSMKCHFTLFYKDKEPLPSD